MYRPNLLVQAAVVLLCRCTSSSFVRKTFVNAGVEVMSLTMMQVRPLRANAQIIAKRFEAYFVLLVIVDERNIDYTTQAAKQRSPSLSSTGEDGSFQVLYCIFYLNPHFCPTSERGTPRLNQRGSRRDSSEPLSKIQVEAKRIPVYHPFPHMSCHIHTIDTCTLSLPHNATCVEATLEI